MRSSEDMAYALYLADYKHQYNNAGPMRSFATSDLSEPLQWDDLEYDDQERYLRYVNALFEHLFEYGRICQYINAEQLAVAGVEYTAYLDSERKTNERR